MASSSSVGDDIFMLQVYSETNGNHITISVSDSDTIDNIKMRIHDTTGISPDQQRITCRGPDLRMNDEEIGSETMAGLKAGVKGKLGVYPEIWCMVVFSDIENDDESTDSSNHSGPVDVMEFLESGGDMNDLVIRGMTDRDWAKLTGRDKTDSDVSSDEDIPPNQPASSSHGDTADPEASDTIDNDKAKNQDK